MTAAPSYVAVKRKREDEPIASLILEERRTKHARVNVEYKLESVSQPSNEPPPKVSSSEGAQRSDQTSAPEEDTSSKSPFVKKTDTLAHKAIKRSGPRQFELASGKRSADTAGLVPTFIERSAKRANVDQEAEPEQRSTPLKRPGTKSAPRTAPNGSGTPSRPTRNEPSAALTAKLNALAFEEAGEPAPKPRVIMQPRATPRRRKAPEVIPQQPPDPVSDDEYVYDIYIRSTSTPSLPLPQPTAPNPLPPQFPDSSLHPVPTDSTAPRSLTSTLPTDLSSLSTYTDHSQDVGYLILPSEESSSYFWSSTSKQPGDLSSSGDEQDDEDSNAEDYYGADYPDDEVDEDDEMGIGAYRFRRGGSEDEDEFADPGWAGRRYGSDGSEDGGDNPWKRFMERERRAMDDAEGDGGDEL
ncbi:hypothetical protein CAC42_8258 [Sphaceloma murrayae]|uniref:Transcription factor Iwr1 domain-containing protein n=1 Tax=Sphaceloma murrayae TaxID=2082308 RepID=A0A2K1QJE6_9PEZI|nr:hypothetical protein CAC42_8258 [Sphaceloma murrayae]